MKNILIYSIHFSKTFRKWKKNLPDASLKFITCMFTVGIFLCKYGMICIIHQESDINICHEFIIQNVNLLSNMTLQVPRLCARISGPQES